MATNTKKNAAKPARKGSKIADSAVENLKDSGKNLKTNDVSGNGKIHEHDIHDLLQTNFGFEQFKDRQQEAIHSLLNGHDTFVIRNFWIYWYCRRRRPNSQDHFFHFSRIVYLISYSGT